MSSFLTNELLELSDDVNNDSSNFEQYLESTRKSLNSPSNLYSSSSSLLLQQQLASTESPDSSIIRRLSSPLKSSSSSCSVQDGQGNLEVHNERQLAIAGNFVDKKREVYKFKTDWLISSIAWSNESRESLVLAASSFIEQYSNTIQLVKLKNDRYDEEIVSVASFEHPYPATKLLFIPRLPGDCTRNPELLATTADYLRIWRVEQKGGNLNSGETNFYCDDAQAFDETYNDHEVNVKLEVLLETKEGSKHCAPLTSFDWNDIDPTLIITASVDRTCTVWDIEINKPIGRTNPNLNYTDYSHGKIFGSLRGQIVTDYNETYDVSCSRLGSGRDAFATVGGDCTLKVFDFRIPTNPIMLFEANKSTLPSKDKPLVRVACNRQDANLIGTFALDSKDVIIIDMRKPNFPVATLSSHLDNLNGISWSQHSAHHICSASDDQQALIWELSKLPRSVDDPLLAYQAGDKINSISWSGQHSDWIAIAYKNYLELLRV